MVEFGRQRPPEPTWKATLWCRCGMVCIWQLTFCIRSKTSVPWKLPSRCSSSGHLTTSPPNPEWKRPATSLVRATCQLFRTAGGGMPPRVGSRNTWMKERRLRHHRMAGPAALVQRQDWSVWTVIRSAYPGRVGLPGPASPSLHVARLRWFLQRLYLRVPEWRRF